MGNIIPENIINILKAVYEVINKPFLTAGSINISVLTLLLFIPVLLIAQNIGKLVGKMVKNSIQKGKISDIIQFRIVKIVRYGVTAIALFVGLTALGINLSSIAVILGALGIGVGFGLQTLISNFSAGLVIFFTGPIKEGDRVTIGKVDGFITKINIISTVVTTLMNETLIVPNSMLISDVCFNHSYNGISVCIENSIKIDYSADVDKAIKIMSEALESSPFVVPGTKASVRLSSFEELGIQLVSYIDIMDVAKKGLAVSYANIAILKAFQQNGIALGGKKVQIKNI